MSVHPHACGEHEWWTAEGVSTYGSSPRMWGTLIQAAIWKIARRFIPTHVGNTGGRVARIKASAVHPHACGEHIIFII